ncbi:aminoglycoside phosphotransferase family protein [Magnetospira sp. QH-2]|uniref:aminoglycoside phosphotransferase family protein n=1 Tax=Magnetospira sp. (strain QH-2) TaxID=1288970 RepID=UPI0003E80F96|nr:phosphotransferase [Magnetospira sp. QH-2]CCQ72587.1 Aminoglycoside phosphotransferase [Magnetospira sp. QH-2]
MTRDQTITQFLDRAGWHDADRRPLADDASFRRYDRVTLGERRAVLMDAPPDKEDVRPFLRVARHLTGLGLSAPEIFAEEADHGLLLLEDLGDDTYTRLLARGGDEEALYALAVDLLIALHRHAPTESLFDGLPPYDDETLMTEALLLPDWYSAAQQGTAPSDSLRDSYRKAWMKVLPRVRLQPDTLVLRDYHVDNLLQLPDRDGVAACGLLDFQDALAGPPAYDVMSLLEDARRDIAPDLKQRMLNRYGAAFPALDRAAFETAFTILAAQRHAKVIGIFTRLCVRDGKPVYLSHIPRVWRLLEAALEHPALAPVAQWVDTHIPPSQRGIPPCPHATP